MAENDFPTPPTPPPVWPAPPGGCYAPPPPQVPPVNATLILVFGILGIVLSLSCIFGGVFGTVAWVMGNSALAILNETDDPMMQRRRVATRRICGIVATGLTALTLLFFLGVFGYRMISSLNHP